MCQHYPAGVSQTNNPQHGDLYVHAKTNGYPYGHVAVIDSVSGTSVNVVEQNSSPTYVAQHDQLDYQDLLSVNVMH